MQAAKRPKFILEALFRPNERLRAQLTSTWMSRANWALFRPIFLILSPTPPNRPKVLCPHIHNAASPCYLFSIAPLRHISIQPHGHLSTYPASHIPS